MSLFSLRILISGLALACIVITAVVCTVIAVLSGDSALTQTKDAAAEGLRQCFDQGDSALNKTRTADGEAISTCFAGATDAIMYRTDELLRTVAGQVAGQLLDQQYNHMRLVLKWYDYIVAEKPLSNTDTNAFLDGTIRGLWSEYRQYLPTGLTSLMIETYPNPPSVGRSRVMFEDGLTTLNAPDEMHHILAGRGDGTPGEYGYGTALFGGGNNRTWDPVWDAYFSRLPGGGLEDPTCRLQWTSKVTGKPCFLSAQPGCRLGVYVFTQGVLDDGWCRLPVEMSDTTAQLLTRNFWPVGQPRVSSLSSFGAYLATAIGMVWGTPTRKIGHIVAAIDVRAYNVYLRGIRVGQAGARSRILIVGEDTWLYRTLPIPAFDNRNYMVAVSSGNSSTYVQLFTDLPRDEFWYWEQHLRLAVQAQDPLIRAAARHIETNVNGSYAAMVDTISSFQMNSTLAGGGWVEDVPGPRHPSLSFYPTVKETLQYINGYREPEDKDRDPLPGYAADGEEFFVAVQRLQSRISGRTPTYDPSVPATVGRSEWFLVVTIDREYVLGETDREQASIQAQIQQNNERIAAEVAAGTEQVRSDIRQSNEDVQDSLDFDRMILYVVVAGSAFHLMLLAVLFAAAIVSPINDLRNEMAQVAVMKLEVVDENRPIHSIEEVGNMQTSFLKMVKNLREYRSYMPASVLVDTDEEVEETEERVPTAPDKAKESDDEDKGSRRASTGGASRVSRSTQNTKVSRSARTAQQEADAAQKAKQATAVGLAKKSSGFMVFNVINFSGLAKTGGAASVLELSGALLTALVEAVRASKGIPDAFNADRFYASWNTVRPAAQPRCAAARSALVLVDSLQSVLGTAQGSWACGGGEVLCGNMGIDGMKKYCCVGVPASFIHLIEPYNAVYETSLLVDARTKQDVENTMLVRTMLMLRYKGADLRVFEVRGTKKMEEDEWMYQLEAAAKADPNRVFSEAMELAFKKEYSEAIDMLTKDENRTQQHDLMIAELSAKL